MSRSTLIERALAAARVDRAPTAQPPSTSSMLVATLVAVVGSLLADALLVAAGTAVFPSTSGFVHFRFFDYATLTVIGVLAACAAWPIVTRLSSAPRWLFFRLAIPFSLVLFLPDIWLLVRHEPIRGVGVLIAMHLAITVVTYNALVHLAPVRAAHDDLVPDVALVPDVIVPGRQAEPAPEARRGPPRTYVWVAMMSGVGIEFLLGVVALILVPYGRPSQWIPVEGRAIYLAHALIGGLLAFGALALLGAVRRLDRISRIAVITGVVGIALGAGGGVLAVDHPSRLLGMGLMLVGSLVAGFAYLVPIVEALPGPTPS